MNEMSLYSGALRSVDCIPGKTKCTFGWGEVGDIGFSSAVGLIRPLLPGPRKHFCSGNAISWNVAELPQILHVLQTRTASFTIYLTILGWDSGAGRFFFDFLCPLASSFVNLFFTQSCRVNKNVLAIQCSELFFVRG